MWPVFARRHRRRAPHLARADRAGMVALAPAHGPIAAVGAAGPVAGGRPADLRAPRPGPGRGAEAQGRGRAARRARAGVRERLEPDLLRRRPTAGGPEHSRAGVVERETP